jgi:hypothetical protein
MLRAWTCRENNTAGFYRVTPLRSPMRTNDQCCSAGKGETKCVQRLLEGRIPLMERSRGAAKGLGLQQKRTEWGERLEDAQDVDDWDTVLSSPHDQLKAL